MSSFPKNPNFVSGDELWAEPSNSPLTERQQDLVDYAYLESLPKVDAHYRVLSALVEACSKNGGMAYRQDIPHRSYEHTNSVLQELSRAGYITFANSNAMGEAIEKPALYVTDAGKRLLPKLQKCHEEHEQQRLARQCEDLQSRVKSRVLDLVREYQGSQRVSFDVRRVIKEKLLELLQCSKDEDYLSTEVANHVIKYLSSAEEE